jgi:phospholipase/carboxylesterase
MTGPSQTRLVSDGPNFAVAGLIHRVREPASPGPHRAVVMLHGRSGDEDVMWVFARSVPANWLLVAPRALKPDLEGGYAWHPRRRDEWPPLAMFDDAVAAVVKLIEALPDLYGADAAHIYPMGFSQGAATAYATAIRRPGLIKGIAALAGFMPVGVGNVVSAAPLAGLPIFMAVGRRDPLIPSEIVQACARTLHEAGARLDYHEYDTGHKLDVKGMQDLKRWWGERDAET